MKEEGVERKWTREELLKLLDEVEKELKKNKKESGHHTKSDEYPEWDDRKVEVAKRVIKNLDECIRGVCNLNKYTSLEHKANIVFRMHLEELFVTKPPFGRYEVDERVWQYLVSRVKKITEKLEECEND